MVSISIMALVFVSLFRMQSGSVNLVEAGRFYTNAPALAQEILGQIRPEKNPSGMEETPGISKQASDHFARQYPGMTWKCQVMDVAGDKKQDTEKSGEEPEPILSHAQGLKKIVVSITQAGRTYEITTFRHVHF